MNRHPANSALREPGGFAKLLHNKFTAWIVLGFSLCLTLFAWSVAQHAVKERLKERFSNEVEDARGRIETRMRKYEQVLRGGVAFFNAAGGTVSRAEWHTYVASLQSQGLLPGIQGFAYSQVVLPQALSHHENAIQAEGFPNYRIQPEGKRDLYTSIVMIEPFDARNQRAFGYDMYSEPTRRAAMDLAMNHGTTAISGLVTLRQEDGIDPQPGFLMYLPVYTPGMPTDTIAQRRAAIQGFVYSPFRAKDLMKGVLGDHATAVNFRIYDDQQIKASSLLYSHDEGGSPSRQFDHLQVTQAIALPNRQWSVVFEPTPALLQQVETDTPLFILFGGAVIDGLLFIVISSLARQRKMQAAQNKVLEESQAKYSGLVAGLKDQFAFFSLAPNGALTFTSPTLPVLLGIPGLSMHQNLLVRARRQFPDSPFAKALAASLAGRATTDFVHEFKRADGSTMVVEGFNSAVRNTHGDMISIEGVVHDITVRRNSEEELKQHRAKLEELVLERTRDLVMANKAKSQFLANMSHEIRTPLHAIMALNQLALVDCQNDADRDRILQVQIEAERLLGMLADVLRFTRLESGEVKPEHQDFDLRHAFLSSLRAFGQRAADKGITLGHFIDPSIPPALRGDAAMYRQVLNNLLSNAIKFSEHGHVRVELHLENTLEKMAQVRTDVIDQGIGFDTREFQRMLEPFEQGDNTTTRQFGGSGLGLSIANRLVAKLGGRLFVQASSPQGSHLSFTARFNQATVPVVQPNATELDTLHRDPALDGKHILVVEDNKLNQQVIQALLARMGVRVSLSQNGEEAICKVQSDPSVDLVLMDLHMPVVNGLDATRAIRILQSPAGKLPIIALTACALEEDEQACREAGMNDYLTKPVNVALLRSTLARFLVKA